MDALLLEKAELQQSLILSRKDLESNKQKAKVKQSKTAILLEGQHQYIWGLMKLDCNNTLSLCRRNLQGYNKSLIML